MAYNPYALTAPPAAPLPNGDYPIILEVTPEMYGAIGDGVTDDTTAITSWLSNGIAICKTSLGKTYACGRINLTINSDLIVTGPGTFLLNNIAILQTTYTEWMLFTSGSSGSYRVIIDGPAFNMNFTAGTGPNFNRPSIVGGYEGGTRLLSAYNYMGVRAIGFAVVAVKNTTWNSPARLFIAQGASNTVRTLAYFHGNVCNGKAAGVNGGFYAYWANRAEFCNNTMFGQSWNQTEQVYWSNVSLEAFAAQYSSNILCDGNYVNGMQIPFLAGLSADLDSHLESGCTITNNIVFEPPADTAAYGFTGVIISNNSIQRSGDWGITFDHSVKIVAEGNRIDGTCVGGMGSFNDLTDVVISGNVIANIAQAYRSAIITAVTRSGSTATATTSAAHGMSAGSVAVVSGLDQSQYNGTFTLLSGSGTTFTYTVSGSPTSPATCAAGFSGGGALASQWVEVPNVSVAHGIDCPLVTTNPTNVHVNDNAFALDGTSLSARIGQALAVGLTSNPSLINSYNMLVTGNTTRANDTTYPNFLISAPAAILNAPASPTGTFAYGETVTGGTSSATATYISKGGNYMLLRILKGVFQASETVTGGTSGATQVIGSPAQYFYTGIIYANNNDAKSRLNGTQVSA